MDVRRYTWNAQEIAADVVDGEAVIINLADGTYYSLDRIGTTIWQAFATPQPTGPVAASLAMRHGITEERAQADVDLLVADMVRERLVVVTDDAAGPAMEQAALDDASGAYATPCLSKYTDMADMLALDPPLPGLQDIPWKTSSGD